MLQHDEYVYSECNDACVRRNGVRILGARDAPEALHWSGGLLSAASAGRIASVFVSSSTFSCVTIGGR